MNRSGRGLLRCWENWAIPGLLNPWPCSPRILSPTFGIPQRQLSVGSEKKGMRFISARFLWLHAEPLVRKREAVPGIIEAKDLHKTFGSTIAVDGIAFSVKKGEVFGFLGPNGAGKTTTMKMIACVSPKTSGTLTVLGMDPDTDPVRIKARLGIVPQETNLDPDFTCYGNLFLYARYFDIPDKAAAKKADELLEFVQ